MLDTNRIQTRYAKSGALNIAYQMFGAGDVDMVFIPGWASNVENIWTLSAFAGFAEKLAKDLVVGSGIQFVDLGAHRLKGVPHERRLFGVARAQETAEAK